MSFTLLRVVSLLLQWAADLPPLVSSLEWVAGMALLGFHAALVSSRASFSACPCANPVAVLLSVQLSVGAVSMLSSALALWAPCFPGYPSFALASFALGQTAPSFSAWSNRREKEPCEYIRVTPCLTSASLLPPSLLTCWLVVSQGFGKV
jgi:hypothetical protein